MIGPSLWLGETPLLWLGVPLSTRHAHLRAPLAPQHARAVPLRAFPGCAQPGTSCLAAQQSLSGYTGRPAARVGRRAAEQERAQLRKAAGCSTAAQNVARKAAHALATTSAVTAAQTESDSAAQVAQRPARRSAQASRLDWLPGAWDGRPSPDARSGGGGSGAWQGKARMPAWQSKARTPTRGNDLVRRLGQALLALRDSDSLSQVLAGQELHKRESTKCGPLTLSPLASSDLHCAKAWARDKGRC